MAIKVTIEFPAKLLADIMVTVVESSVSSSWLNKLKLVAPDKRALTERPWYSDPKLYKGEFSLIAWEDETGYAECPLDCKRHLITQADFEAGAAIMTDKFPGHFGDLMSENWDAEIADVFFQCVVLKDVVYG